MNKDTAKNKALVVGDLMLDESIFGVASRLTPEGPVPVILKNNTEFTLGGAGFVAKVLSDLDINVTLCGVVGDDETSDILRSCCKEGKINSSEILNINGFKTSKKTRVYASGHLVARLDDETEYEMNDATRKKCLESIEGVLENQEYKVCIISDYNKGFCDDGFIRRLIKLCSKYEVITLVDPKTEDVNKFIGADLIKPNNFEAAKILGVSKEHLPLPEEVVKQISSLLEISNVLYTRGSKGMILLSGSKIKQIEAIQQEVFNVVGAGDTVLAGLCAGLINGHDIEKSSLIANDLAGEMVSKLSRKIKPSNSIKEKLST